MYHNKVFLALGSNVGNWKNNFNNCLKLLCNIGELRAIGNIYISKPYGYVNQKNFYNTAVEFKTNLKPIQLILELKNIEKKLHKKKLIINGPRRIDIDIIFFNNLKVNTGSLIIPHPRATDRDFVIFPINDINPFFIHPLQKKSIKNIKMQLKDIYIETKIKQPIDSFEIF